MPVPLSSVSTSAGTAAHTVPGSLYFKYQDEKGRARKASVFDLLPLELQRGVCLQPQPVRRPRRAHGGRAATRGLQA